MTLYNMHPSLSTAEAWTFAGKNVPISAKDYYNITSTSETHWPAVESKGWLLEVDPLSKSVLLMSGARGSSRSSLRPWLNPWSNGQKLPPAADCTMFDGVGSMTVCKLPYCGETIRPVAAQQFNVLALGGHFLYYGERWQSTPSGLKSEDFSYLEPLRFDAKGVMQRMHFNDSFKLPA
jgi:hypothetical protein